MTEDQKKTSENEGGYGGGRERAENAHEHQFGETGVADKFSAGEHEQPDRPMPEPVKDVGSGGPGWQERFTKENADKYGQSGGEPIAQRGASQSAGGEEHKEQGLGDAKDVTPRGTYGARETEKWPEPDSKRRKKQPNT